MLPMLQLNILLFKHLWEVAKLLTSKTHCFYQFYSPSWQKYFLPRQNANPAVHELSLKSDDSKPRYRDDHFKTGGHLPDLNFRNMLFMSRTCV